MDSNEREELDELVASPGWQRFCQHVEQEWGNVAHGGGARFTYAARTAANDVDDATAIVKMRQVCFAQREVLALIAWVNGSLKDATKRDQEFAAVAAPNFSRRGDL